MNNNIVLQQIALSRKKVPEMALLLMLIGILAPTQINRLAGTIYNPCPWLKELNKKTRF